MTSATKFLVLTLFGILLSSSVIGMQNAEAGIPKTVKLKHLGVLQLAAHDLFNVDRDLEVDFENGLLDLSTLLVDLKNGGVPFSDMMIANGGEFRNAENVMIFTVASSLGQMYLDERALNGEQAARQAVLDEYYLLLEDAYMAAFDEPFPAASPGCVTLSENLALRTVHDFLPEEIDGMNIFEIMFGVTLDSNQLEMDSSPLDGVFDDAFSMDTLIPALGITVNLLEKDQSFGTQFNLPFTFDGFLMQLTDGSYDSGEPVFELIKSVFAKGLADYHTCYVGGSIIPVDSVSLLVSGVQSSLSWIVSAIAIASVSVFFLRRK